MSKTTWKWIFMEVVDSISQLLTIYFIPKFATAMIYCTVKPVNYFHMVLPNEREIMHNDKSLSSWPNTVWVLPDFITCLIWSIMVLISFSVQLLYKTEYSSGESLLWSNSLVQPFISHYYLITVSYCLGITMYIKSK